MNKEVMAVYPGEGISELSDGRRMNRPNGILLPPMHLNLKSPVHYCPTIRSC